MVKYKQERTYCASLNINQWLNIISYDTGYKEEL